MQPVYAQDSSTLDVPAIADLEEQEKIDRLQSIGILIKAKRTQRDELSAQLKGAAPDAMNDERDRLDTVKQDLDSLRSSFEQALLEDIDTHIVLEAETEQFNWRDELVEVVEPLISSLKSMTKRPRQMADLRKSIELDTRKLAVADQALLTVDDVPAERLNEGATVRLKATQEKWNDSRNLINERLMNSQSQLARLQNNERSFTNSLLSGTKEFFTGRGLTILIAGITAATGCALMRLCWHFFNTRLIKRSVRRKATWYRLLAYSYHLLTLIIAMAIVMTVFYLRQDVLLMGLAFVALAAVIISLRSFLPRFLKEVRYLLNLGAVREDECVIHAGIPWQVMSLNIMTVLRNPALEGVIRLPLDVMSSKVSRPIVRDEVWFPTHRNDYIILPDQTFGRVINQTPELVCLSVKGGMSMTIPTADFYSTSTMNLSSSDTFGIAVVFGLDYSLQKMSLSTIPETIKAGVIARLRQAGYGMGKDITDILVELAKANASSIDFLIYTSVNSGKAADYYAIERLVQQACVAVANEQGWQIPFPQLTLHHQSAAQELTNVFKKAA